ncbi:Hypothetical protein FKW44_010997 [Caligus rogercresseyi]|uniref:Uncharacterized protein n=1 Tax=Caligus rogercresseyi TaxID=217165 RepID=A0A7T8HHS0_CALRO|nr:Hypothetical protein FKW44_010997 [Caligus rogercresseyi]
MEVDPGVDCIFLYYNVYSYPGAEWPAGVLGLFPVGRWPQETKTAVDSLPMAYWGLYKAGEGIIVPVDKLIPLRSCSYLN